MLNQLIHEGWVVLRESAAFILLGFLIAAGLHAVLRKTNWARLLQGTKARTVVLASAIGLPLPLCSCSVLPAAISLRKQGAGKGATLSFLISTPETSVQSVLLTYALLGPVMAIYRALAACVTALVAGLAENFFEKRYPVDAPEGADEPVSDCCGDKSAESGDCCDTDPAESTCCGSQPAAEDGDCGHDHAGHNHSGDGHPGDGASWWRGALRHAFVDIYDDVVGWMLLGVVVAAVIQVLIPGFILDAVFGPPLQAMLVMLVIGVPLYICAEASTPMAAALILKGVNPGAALVFLLAGPATNIGSVGLLVRQLGKRTVVIYLTSIAVVSVLMGLGLNMLFDARGIDITARAMAEPLLPGWFKTLGAILFLLLAIGSIYRRRYISRFAGWLDRLLPVRVTPARLGIAALLLAVIGYASTGLFAVQPGQVGIVKHFGRIVDDNAQPGLHYMLPYPFGSVDRVDVREVRRLVLGTAAGSQDADESESWVLLGDENIANIACGVQWRMAPGEAVRFAYATADAERLVQDAVRGGLREALSSANIDTVFTTDQDDLAADVASIAQSVLDRCESGIELVSFNFLDLHAPAEVHSAFRDVASALEDQSRFRNEALTQQARIIPLAEGAKHRDIRDAAAYLSRVVADAKGKSAGFLAQLESYNVYPELTRSRMLFETFDRVLPGLKKCIRPSEGNLMLDLRYDTGDKRPTREPM